MVVDVAVVGRLDQRRRDIVRAPHLRKAAIYVIQLRLGRADDRLDRGVVEAPVIECIPAGAREHEREGGRIVLEAARPERRHAAGAQIAHLDPARAGVRDRPDRRARGHDALVDRHLLPRQGGNRDGVARRRTERIDMLGDEALGAGVVDHEVTAVEVREVADRGKRSVGVGLDHHGLEGAPLGNLHARHAHGHHELLHAGGDAVILRARLVGKHAVGRGRVERVVLIDLVDALDLELGARGVDAQHARGDREVVHLAVLVKVHLLEALGHGERAPAAGRHRDRRRVALDTRERLVGDGAEIAADVFRIDGGGAAVGNLDDLARLEHVASRLGRVEGPRDLRLPLFPTEQQVREVRPIDLAVAELAHELLHLRVQVDGILIGFDDLLAALGVAADDKRAGLGREIGDRQLVPRIAIVDAVGDLDIERLVGHDARKLEHLEIRVGREIILLARPLVELELILGMIRGIERQEHRPGIELLPHIEVVVAIVALGGAATDHDLDVGLIEFGDRLVRAVDRIVGKAGELLLVGHRILREHAVAVLRGVGGGTALVVATLAAVAAGAAVTAAVVGVPTRAGGAGAAASGDHGTGHHGAARAGAATARHVDARARAVARHAHGRGARGARRGHVRLTHRRRVGGVVGIGTGIAVVAVICTVCLRVGLGAVGLVTLLPVLTAPVVGGDERAGVERRPALAERVGARTEGAHGGDHARRDRDMSS